MARLLACVALICAPLAAEAQFGRRNKMQGEASGIADATPPPSDVDIAMAGWEQLSRNPDKMQEVMQGMKDPEVMAKAAEMLKDPQYMKAAKAKLAELEAKAKARGMLDAQGNPVPGMATATAMGQVPGGAAAMGGAAASDASEWELRNADRHKAGELNTAELGMANLQQAARDPSVMQGVMEMMKDPNTRKEVEALMADPAFKAQAQQMMAGVKDKVASMAPSDMAAMARSMGLEVTPEQMAQAQQQMAGMAGGMGMGGGGMGGASELEMLRRENAAMKRALHDEL